MCLKKPSELTLTCIHCFVENCWIWSQSPYNELLRACRTWPGTCTSYLLKSSLCSSRCDLVVLQLNLACSHLRAFPFPVPFTSQALSSLRPSSVSPKCQITFSRGLPGPSCSKDSSCSPRAGLLRPRFAFLYKLAAQVYKLGHTLSCCLPSVQAGISSLQFRAVFWGIGL